MLYNDYRPQKFSEVIGQKDVIDNIMAQSARDKFFGVYILCGQFGSGKTTTARIIAMAANCEHKDVNGNPCGKCESCRTIRDGVAPDVQEVAAAVSTGVDKIREICDTVVYLPVVSRKKVYIIDEVQALSKAAFQAFLKMLEEPPEHAIFILATTDVGAIPPTVRSRAATYYFKQLTRAEISDQIRYVSDMEKYPVTKDACTVIAKYSQGSMRNALSLLDIATQDGKPVTGEKVEKLLGVSTPDTVFAIIRDVLCGNAANIITGVNNLAESGADLSLFVSDMLNAVSDLTVASVSTESVRGTEHYMSLVKETVIYGSSVRFTAIADELYEAIYRMGKAPDISTLIVSLVRLARRSDVVEYKEAPGEDVIILRNKVSVLEARLRELENRIARDVTLTESIEKMSPTEIREEAEATEKAVSETVTEKTEDAPASEHTLVLENAEEVTTAQMEQFTATEEAVRAENNSSVKDVEEDEEDNFFAFIGLGKKEKKEHNSAARDAWKNQQKLETDVVYKAVMSCCDVIEDGEAIIIASEFPVAKRFTNILLAAYGRNGYEVTGIKVI